MSVYINMEMPKDCPMCPLAHWDFTGEFRGCKVVNGKKYAMETEPGYPETNFRPSWCPLVPVPEHGRLIDADKMRESIRRQTGLCKLMGGELSDVAEAIENGFLQEIANAPTIIPADKEGEG